MIAVISGTNRLSNNTIKVARQVAEIFRGNGETVELMDLRNLPAAAFTPEAYGDKPESFLRDFTDKLLAADGVVMVVPEYNGSFPGILKHFVDLLPFPESFQCRPVAFIGLSAGYYGALRAVEQMQMVFAYRNAHLFNQRVFLPAVHKLLGEDGKISDPEVQARLEEQALRFCAYIRDLKPA